MMKFVVCWFDMMFGSEEELVMLSADGRAILFDNEEDAQNVANALTTLYGEDAHYHVDIACGWMLDPERSVSYDPKLHITSK